MTLLDLRRPREYTMPVAAQGYAAGTVLRNVSLHTARKMMECSRCGDCCDGRRPDVIKDQATGLPKFIWEAPETAAGTGSQTADPHRYDDRSDSPQRLILPVIEIEGELLIGDDFDRDADDQPYTSFTCSALREWPEGPDGPETGCVLRAGGDREERRPLNCGAFPVFGQEVDDSLIANGSYVPPTGNLPRCEWYGIRIVGPWKER